MFSIFLRQLRDTVFGRDNHKALIHWYELTNELEESILGHTTFELGWRPARGSLLYKIEKELKDGKNIIANYQEIYILIMEAYISISNYADSFKIIGDRLLEEEDGSTYFNGFLGGRLLKETLRDLDALKRMGPRVGTFHKHSSQYLSDLQNRYLEMPHTSETN